MSDAKTTQLDIGRLNTFTNGIIVIAMTLHIASVLAVSSS